MSDNYKKTLLRLATAQVCASIGYNSTQISSLELLQDILNKFLIEFARDLRHHVEHYSRHEPHLGDLLLCFHNLRISLKSLKEFINNVDQSAFAAVIPQFPKVNALNLKFPNIGKDESIIIVPQYVFEYLPTMLQCASMENLENLNCNEAIMEVANNSQDHQKKHKNIYISSNESSNISSNVKKTLEDFTAVNRQLPINTSVKKLYPSSVGFTSPSVEGRLADVLKPIVFDKWKDLDAPPPSPPLLLNVSSKKIESNISKPSKVIVDKNHLNLLQSNQSLSKVKGTSSSKKDPIKTNLKNNSPTDFDGKTISKLVKTSSLSNESVAFNKQDYHDKDAMNLKRQDSTNEPKKNMKKLAKIKQKNFKRLSIFGNNSDAKAESSRKVSSSELFIRHFDDAPESLLDPSKDNIKIGRLNVLSNEINNSELTNNSSRSYVTVSENIKEDSFTNAGNVISKNIAGHEAKAKQNDLNTKNEINNVSNTSFGPENTNNMYKSIKIKNSFDADASHPSNTISQLSNINHFIQSGIIQKSIDFEKSSEILLPSGTDITATSMQNPTLNNHNNKCISNVTHNMLTNIDSAISQTSSVPSTEQVKNETFTNVIEVVKKKRGRKPGSKNGPKMLQNMNRSNATSFNSKNVKNLLKSCSDLNNKEITSGAPYSIVGKEDSTNVPKKIKRTKKTTPLLLNNSNESEEVQMGDRWESNLLDQQQQSNLNNLLKSQNNISITRNTSSISKYNVSNNKNEINGASESMKLSVAALSAFSGLLNSGFDDNETINSTNSLAINTTSNKLSLLPLFGFPQGPGLIPQNPPSSSTNLLFSSSDAGNREFLTFPNLLNEGKNRDAKVSVEDSINLKSNGELLSEHLTISTDRSFCNVAPLIPPDYIKSNAGNKKNDDTVVSQKRLSNSSPSLGIGGKGFQNYGASNTYIPSQLMKCSQTTTTKQKYKSQAANDFFNAANNWSSMMLQEQQSISEPIEVSDDSNENETMVCQNELRSIINPKLKNKSTSELLSPSANFTATLTSAPTMPITEIGDGDLVKSRFKKLAGGADLIPLTGSYTGLAYSSKSVPPTSLTGNPNSFNSGCSEKVSSQLLEQEDTVIIASTFNQDILNSLKTKQKNKKSKDPSKIKTKKKKEKKEKLKLKDSINNNYKSTAISLPSQTTSTIESGLNNLPLPVSSSYLTSPKSEKKMEKKRKREKNKAKLANEVYGNQGETTSIFYDRQSESCSSSRINSFDISPSNEIVEINKPREEKKLSKSVLKQEEPQAIKPASLHRNQTSQNQRREMSPELVRISPLITRPPKQKHYQTITTPTEFITTKPFKEFESSFDTGRLLSVTAVEVPPPNPWISGGTLSASSVLLPQQLLNSSTSSSKSMSNSNASSYSSTQAGNTETLKSSYVDEDGNTIWICPACGKVDDGSPMIGCDGCDAWYHWSCVGITIAPNANEDWFCRPCGKSQKRLYLH